MRLYREGDKSAGICETCKCRVSTTMTYRDYRPTGWDVAVPDVMVASCDQCGAVVGVPHQSMAKINEFRTSGKLGAGSRARREQLEGRIPRGIEELMGLIASSLGGEPSQVQPAIFRYYLGLVARDAKVAREVKLGSTRPLAMGRADRRLTIKVPGRQLGPALSAAKEAGITTKAQLLRGIAVLAADDIRISHGPAADRLTAKPTPASRARNKFLRDLAMSL